VSGESDRGGWPARLALLAGSTVFALLVAEAAFRIFGLGAPPPAPPGAPVAEDEAAAKAAGERKNSLGFRGPEWKIEKPPGTFRMLFVGDSFTFGRGIPEDRIFASLVASRFGAEVLNLSKPGWDTASEVKALEDVGLNYSPDLVVITFFLNDATHLDSNPVIAWRMNREVNQRDGFLNRISRLYDTWDYISRKRRVSQETMRDYRDSYLGSPDRTELWNQCRKALAEARDRCAERKVRLAVDIFPMLVELGPDYPFRDVHEAVANACRELGIPVVDLLPAFEGKDGPSLWIAPDNGHPNIEGHAIAAEAIARFLAEQGLVPPGSPGPGAVPAAAPGTVR
jgi:hypothetical protein